MIDLEELKKLCEKATSGPWVVSGASLNEVRYIVKYFGKQKATQNWEPFYPTGNAQEDAAFIAAARTAVPELIAEVERLREIIDMERDEPE